MNWTEYDFKHATLILDDMNIKGEIERVLRSVTTPLGRHIRPTPSKVITDAFLQHGWEPEYQVSERSGNLRFDLYKNGVAIEIQLTDPADCYNDYLKFLLAYNLERIEIGVEIVYDESVKGNNLPKLQRAANDLNIFRRVISCPTWVIGLKED
jgi:histone acetyltransferase (RNA polymerase elongator complex component)